MNRAKVANLEEQLECVHLFLDDLSVPRRGFDNNHELSLVGRIKNVIRAEGVSGASVLVAELADIHGGQLLSKIEPCKDCGAAQGELCRDGCTQESYQCEPKTT